jgi:glyoxylase-like metal-dependent hydrolase (beta-lactamase superfamily II)
MGLASQTLSAQMLMDGEWAARYHEDQVERIPGPDLGDYLGLPLNDAARLKADSWSASRLTLPEEQCRVHVAPYIYRGPMLFRMWQEKDPETQQVVAIRNFLGTYSQNRTIWMDGRPHPPAWAPHTWMGFSTGKWEGDILSVYTTHIKQGWVRRNGTPQSDAATMMEHFIRHGDIMTHVTILTDPVYLTEPLIKTENFVLDLHATNGQWVYHCRYVDEIEGRKKGQVDNYLPGENPFLKEFSDRFKLPYEAVRGGAETMYPEYKRAMTASKKGAVGKGRVVPVTTVPDVEVTPVQGNVYLIAGAGGNMLLQTGEQGTLLVDTGSAWASAKVLAAIQKTMKAPIRWVLNTNADEDHAGGNFGVTSLSGTSRKVELTNTPFGTAKEAAEFVAREEVLNRMSKVVNGKTMYPSDAWPTETYANGIDEIYLNGEAVQMIHAPNAHTDGDSLVYFRKSDVIATGGLFDSDRYPVIDVANGGSINGIIDGLNHILDITVPAYSQEGGTMVIPGRGRICDEADVVEYRDMVTIVRDRIQAMIKKGMTLDQIQAARPTLDYDPLYGSTSGDWTTDQFVEAAYRSLVKK